MSNDQSLDGLHVPGHHVPAAEAVAAVSVMKRLEEEILQLLDALRTDAVLAADQRWLSIGRTEIEQGFMAVNRSILKPERIVLDRPSLADQWSE